MNRPEPVQVVDLFPALLAQLRHVLSALSVEQWNKPSPCPGWSVKDVGLHLLHGDIGQLSRERDHFLGSLIPASTWEELVTGLNKGNENWVSTNRGISHELLLELLEFTGSRVNSLFSSVDLSQLGPVVSWAGSDPSPMWLHVAREYTERWHHQQQIREALNLPLLVQPELFRPVLATFVHALPRTYSDVTAKEGTIIKLSIVGDSGGDWYVVRGSETWDLFVDVHEGPDAELRIGQIDAWKLFTRSLPKTDAADRVEIRGDHDLALKALDTVSIIA